MIKVSNKKLMYSTWTKDDLRIKREHIGVTQSKMAEMLGISARMYRYYEGGRTPISKPMEYAMEYLSKTSQISSKLRTELTHLSKFEYDRISKLRNAIETSLDHEMFENMNGQTPHIKRIFTQTLKEFDIVLSKAKK